MLIKEISNFKNLLYEALAESDELKKLNCSICLNVKLHNQYPFVLINMKRCSNISRKSLIYEIELEIDIFSRDKSSESSSIASTVEKILTSKSNYGEVNVISARLNEISNERSEDLQTNKMKNLYYLSIKRVA